MTWRTAKRGAFTAAMVLMASVSTGCGGGDDDEAAAPFSGDLIVTSQGTSLVMYGVRTAGTVAQLGSASLPSDGLLPEHAIFGITKHPTQNWLYVGSLNECSDGTNACWGNARIDRFTYGSDGSLTYAGVAFAFTAGSGPACADGDWGYAGQVGTCAPTNTAFSADGSRLYVDCDSLDGVQIFSVDPAAGNLTFLWEGSSTTNNGLAVSPGGGYLYNGSRTIALTSDTAAAPVGGSGGNDAEIVTTSGGGKLLVTTGGVSSLGIYDLTSEAAPSLIDSLALPPAPVVNWANGGSARSLDASADLATFIVAGTESVATVGFDGSTLTLLDQVFDADDALDVIFRSAAITKDGRHALATWFIPYDATGTPQLNVGGMTLYGIAADGTLTALNLTGIPAPARAALRLP